MPQNVDGRGFGERILINWKDGIAVLNDCVVVKVEWNHTNNGMYKLRYEHRFFLR